NRFEYNWQGQADQFGFAILITPKNQSGLAPVATTNDITFRLNKIAHSTNAMSIASGLTDQGSPSMGMHRISVHDNLFDDINHANYTVYDLGPGGRGFALGNGLSSPASSWPDHITLNHNTLM